MSSLKHARLYQAALAERGVPSVLSGGTSVLVTQAGDEWLALLEALEQPQRTGRIRAIALTSFLGHSPEELDAGGDDLTDELAEQVRRWLDLMRGRGVAAVHESLISNGLAARVLARPQGERLLTDLNHLGQVLHEVAHRENLGLVALLGWLRAERRVAAKSNERTRRLDTDAKAVQLITIHGSKGQQYPVVYLPELFNCWPGKDTEHLFHDDRGRRTLDIGGVGTPPQALAESAGEELPADLRGAHSRPVPGGHLVRAELGRRARRAHSSPLRSQRRRGRGPGHRAPGDPPTSRCSPSCSSGRSRAVRPWRSPRSPATGRGWRSRHPARSTSGVSTVTSTPTGGARPTPG